MLTHSHIDTLVPTRIYVIAPKYAHLLTEELIASYHYSLVRLIYANDR